MHIAVHFLFSVFKEMFPNILPMVIFISAHHTAN